AGDGASRVVGNTLTLEVEIQDEHTNVISNTPVTFAIAPGTTDATFVRDLGNDDVTFTATTDANGRAAADLSVGTVATTFQVSVTAGDASEVFTVTATPDVPATLVVTGSGQTGVVGQPLDDEIVAEVRDQYDNPVVGAEVSCTPVGGAGSFSPAAVTVGEDALAASTWALGTVPGEQKAMVSVGALSEEITALAQPGAPFLVVKVAGDGAS